MTFLSVHTAVGVCFVCLITLVFFSRDFIEYKKSVLKTSKLIINRVYFGRNKERRDAASRQHLQESDYLQHELLFFFKSSDDSHAQYDNSTVQFDEKIMLDNFSDLIEKSSELSTSTSNNRLLRKLAITYFPGNLNVQQNGLLLSQGLTSTIIARKGNTVSYTSGLGKSKASFHSYPDGAATFVDDDPKNPGGWIYVSNSETRNTYDGGVGALKFDKNGGVIDYKMVLTKSRANCSGGRTPWGVSTT